MKRIVITQRISPVRKKYNVALKALVANCQSLTSALVRQFLHRVARDLASLDVVGEEKISDSPYVWKDVRPILVPDNRASECPMMWSIRVKELFTLVIHSRLQSIRSKHCGHGQTSTVSRLMDCIPPCYKDRIYILLCLQGTVIIPLLSM